MLDRISVFTLTIFIISIGALIYILNSNYIPSYMLGYGVPVSIISGFALVAFVLAVKKK